MNKGILLFESNTKIKNQKIKFIIFSFLGFSGVILGLSIFTFYNNVFIRILLGSILIIALIISTFSLVLSYVSRPFRIFEKGMTYPAPPQPEWNIYQAIKYGFIPFDKIKEIKIKNDIVMRIIFNGNENDLNIYLNYIGNLNVETLIDAIKETGFEKLEVI